MAEKKRFLLNEHQIQLNEHSREIDYLWAASRHHKRLIEDLMADEDLNEAIRSLAVRVADLEDHTGGWNRTLVDRSYNLNETHPEEVMITKADLARLRRVEEAARELIEKIDQHPDHRYAIAGPRVNTLRAALDSEPRR